MDQSDSTLDDPVFMEAVNGRRDGEEEEIGFQNLKISLQTLMSQTASTPSFETH